MIPALVLLMMLGDAPQMAPPEPDGSRTFGVVPPFRAEPSPPAWLRSRSHTAAWVDTQHYLYEAYAGPAGQWLVRYVMLPEGSEAYREIEQVFLFQPDPRKPPAALKPAEVAFEPRGASWRRQAFTLVDRRDLLRP